MAKKTAARSRTVKPGTAKKALTVKKAGSGKKPPRRNTKTPAPKMIRKVIVHTNDCNWWGTVRAHSWASCVNLRAGHRCSTA